MAITGILKADFSNFYTAVQTAEGKLQSFAEGSRKAKVSLQEFDGASTAAVGPVNSLRTTLGTFDGLLSSVGINVGPAVRGLGELGDAAGKSASELGLVGTAGLALGVGMAAWGITRAAMDFLGLDAAVTKVWQSLLGTSDAAQVAGAKQDTINKAIRDGAGAHITYAEAIAFNNQKLMEFRQESAANEERLKANAAAFERMQKLVNAATEKWRGAMVELNSVGVDWHSTLDRMSGSTVEAIKYYLQAGVSQASLATAYQVTATQVKAVASALSDEAKELAVTMERRAAVTNGIAQELLAEAQAIQVHREAATAITGETSAYDVMMGKLSALHALKQAGADQTVREHDIYDQYTQTLYDQATAADTARDAQDNVNRSIGAVPGVTNAAAAAMHGLIDTMKDYKSFGQEGWFGWAPTGAIPPVISLPSTPNLPGGTPRGGTWTPPRSVGAGAVSSGALTVNVAINGSVLGNKDEIARVVGDALVGQMRASGVRMGT